MDKKALLLYAVTDRSWTGKKRLYDQVEEALSGGATCIQLREKGLDTESFIREATEIKELCSRYGVPLIINDNVEVAVKVRADGVHVGQDDMPARRVREIAGEKIIVGVSAHTQEEAVKAQKDGADYLGAGAVFPTGTKTDVGAMPYDTLKAICASVDIPVVAIGGINKNNMKKLSGSGIAGVALVSAIFSADDIKKECAELRALAKETVSE
jgi:thiamine-phosphate pyrophosphorylase